MLKRMRREILVWVVVSLICGILIWNPSGHFGMLTGWKGILIRIELSICLSISLFFYTVLFFAVSDAMKEIDDDLRRKDTRHR